MSIEFPGIKPTRFQPARDSNSSAIPANAQQEHKSAGNDDQLTLTRDAGQMERLTAAVRATPTVDIHRIEGIKRELSNGHFVVDAQRVAARLAKFEGRLTHSLAA